MTRTAARPGESPARAAAPPPFEGALFIDLEGQRARYECLRPGCPRRLEGPVCATDHVAGEDGAPTRRGPGGVATFIAGIKTYHLSTYHGSSR
ncbi:hypothetical protein AB0E11_27580 [Streptomyces fradiae]|uniref:hypothetical protein n=1 Tax=Streptomyces fradiae TaxID=1906 RepID=UPI002943C76B|nr:hypothetical protein [Streptomyces fradiae]WOI58637.1 hypothetical protein RYQ63_01055 [Streptomyces fradiae]